MVSDTQWALFCQAFGLSDLRADARLGRNNDRVRARDWLMPILRERMGIYSAAELAARFEQAGLPYAPITQPQQLFDDPHLLATGGLAPVNLPADASSAGHPLQTRTALLPVALDGARLPVRTGPPAIGEHTRDLLRALGYTDDRIEQLRSDGVIATPAEATEPPPAGP